MSENPTLRLLPPAGALQPGDETRWEIVVRNRASVVDQFNLQVLGPAAVWAAIEPPSVSLFPDEEGRAHIVFRPPRSFDIAPGPLPIGIRASSQTDPERSTVEEASLTIGAFQEVAADLRPRTSKGRFTGRHDVRLHCLGNEPVQVTTVGDDPDGALDLSVNHSRASVRPGERRSVRVKAHPRHTIWVGAAESHPFEVQVTTAGGSDIRLAGVMKQQPVATRLMAALAVGLIALGGLAVAYKQGALAGLRLSGAVSSAGGASRQGTDGGRSLTAGAASGSAGVVAPSAASPSPTNGATGPAPTPAGSGTAPGGQAAAGAGQSAGAPGGGRSSTPPPPATSLDVVVRADGSLVRGTAGTATAHQGAGVYAVTFSRDVSGCGYNATIGDPANALVYNPGLAFVHGGAGATVIVQTLGLNGQPGDWSFHLHVICDAGALWAVVRSDGATVRGAGEQGSTHLGVGRYELTFAQDVSRCAYIATVGDPGSAPIGGPNLVFTAGGHNGPRDVYVETKNMGGGLTDLAFHLAVSCGDQASWVATDYQGGMVRGSAGASVTHLGTGRFEVAFNQNVSGCAYVATVADPTNQLVYSPGLVFTAGGHSGANDVYVETKNLGGGLGDWPFHVAVAC